MATKFYKLNFGMKQHPQTFEQRGFGPLEPGQLYPGGYKNLKDFQLLYAGDIFAAEEHLIERPKESGGWQDRKVRDLGDGITDVVYQMDIAEVLPDWKGGEVWTLRDEPSKVIGINISEQDYAKQQAEEGDLAGSIAPVQSAAANAPSSVATGPAKVRRS